MRLKKTGVWLFLMLAVGSGCGGPISQSLRQEVRPNLEFQQVLQSPESHRGAVVIWGGKIVEVNNRGQATVLTILQMPLNARERPVRERESQGRFLACVNRFLDPELYRRGRRVTVAGTVLGQESRVLGEGEYAYPLVQIQEIHLWRPRRAGMPYDYPYPPYPYFWPGWDAPLVYPDYGYWDGWAEDEDDDYSEWED